MKHSKTFLLIILSALLTVSVICFAGCEMIGKGVFDLDSSSGAIETSSGENSGDSLSVASEDSSVDQSGIEPQTSSSEPQTSDEPQTSSDSQSGGDSSSSEPEIERTVKVTFNAGNGSEIVVFEGKAGDPFTMPADPVRDGYYFDGWESGGEVVDLTVFPDANLRVSAKWSRIIRVYFNAGNGSEVAVFEGRAGAPLTMPADPERNNYAFGGWESGGKVVDLTVFPDGDMTLTARWIRLVSVTFDAGNGTANKIVRGKPGDLIVAPVDPVREGYAFVGWKLNGEDFVFIFPESDVTLNAAWSRTVTVYFDTGTSDVTLSEQTVEYGSTIAEPVISREGYLLRRWSYKNAAFDFGSAVTSNITLTAEWLERTNLPTMSIELFKEDGSTFNIYNLTKNTYVKSSISLTNGDGELELDGAESQMKGRGNGSWTTPSSSNDPKNGYKLKFEKKKSLFGREANKHWVLLACINFDDVTMCRNYTAFNVANEVFDDIEYTTNAVWVDLFVNGEYRGVYDLCEHVRVGAGRVDIESEYGVNDTGYLIEYDAYAADGGTVKGVDYFSINNSGGVINHGGSSSDLVKYGFSMHSPSPEDYETEGKITQAQYREQVVFIQDYVRRTYASIITDKNFTTFASLADVNSFVDMYILQEFYKNTDTGFSSFFLYKKPGGKLYAGPAWDFDATTNADNKPASGIYVASRSRASYSYWNGSSELLVNLYENTQFKSLVVARWKELSPQIAAYFDNFFTEDFYSTYGDAMAKNFYRWKSHSSLSSAKTAWINNARTLSTWFKDRISYLNGEWK